MTDATDPKRRLKRRLTQKADTSNRVREKRIFHLVGTIRHRSFGACCRHICLADAAAHCNFLILSAVYKCSYLGYLLTAVVPDNA